MGHTGWEHMMSIEALKSRIPEYAKDLKLNLGSLATEPSLSVQQRAGSFVAAALASRNAEVSAEALAAAKAAAAIMGMNNVYYRFTHEVGGDYPNMPARLRMNVMAKPGVDKADFELWSLAVSAVNGCAMCMESHEKVVRQAAFGGRGGWAVGGGASGGGAHRRGGARRGGGAGW